ncbi:hypothetical protein P8452_02561 [Trifolium repens]|nr:hypothetical protein P8452_02561 [Trifolium repens]
MLFWHMFYDGSLEIRKETGFDRWSRGEQSAALATATDSKLRLSQTATDSKLQNQGSVKRIEVRIEAHGTLTELTVTNRRPLLRIEALVPLPPTKNTKQTCTFRDLYEKFNKAGAKIVGMSGDDSSSHKAFAKMYKLPLTKMVWFQLVYNNQFQPKKHIDEKKSQLFLLSSFNLHNWQYITCSFVFSLCFVSSNFERNGKPIGIKIASDWLYVYPSGIRDLLLYTKEKYNNPSIYITKNGINEYEDSTLSVEE